MSQAIFAFACLGALLGGGRDQGARVSRDPGPRAEYFILELPALESLGGNPVYGKPREVGAVCLRRRRIEGGFQLEGEWLFRRSEEEGGDERVLHVEQILGNSARLIWREWGPARARSVTVDRSAEGLLSIVDSGRGGTARETIAVREGASMPLELLERIRFAEAIPATCDRFDPLSRSAEAVEVRHVQPTAGMEGVQVVRADGSLAGGYEFLGAALQTFRWQDGDIVARRVTEEEYRAACPVPAVSIQRP
jgi:hypothetical protein